MADTWWNEIRDPPMYYNRLGVPISLREWSTLMEDLDYRRIGLTTVGRFTVSTVWLGLDHSLRSFTTAFGRGDHVPLIFETMVFDDSEGDDHDLEMERYATEAAARDGHARMVQLVESWSDPDR